MGIKQYSWSRPSTFRYRTRPRGSNTWSDWTTTNSSNGKTFTSRYSSSESTPNFKKVKRASLPMHPHAMHDRYSEYEWTTSSALWVWPDGSSAENQYQGHSDNWGVSADVSFVPYYPSEEPIDQLALARLFEDLSLSKGSAAVTMAEIGKTAKMVAETATRFVSAARAARRGNLGAFTDALGISVSKRRLGASRTDFHRSMERTGDSRQFAAKTWLEYTYGWKPLINDVYAHAENLANYLTDRQYVIRTARGSAREKKVTIVVPSNVGGGWKLHKQVEAELRIGYVVNYRLADGGNSIVNVFGLNNPLIVAWELVPFSFVADWFLPIGNFLEQLTATSGLVFHSGVKTRKLRDTAAGRVSNPPPVKQGDGSTLYDTIQSGGGATHSNWEKSRTVLSSFPQPRLPSFRAPSSVYQALSGLSLMQVVFNGGASRR